MSNGKFADVIKTVAAAVMFAALVEGLPAQAYATRGNPYDSGGGSTSTQPGRAARRKPGARRVKAQREPPPSFPAP